MMKRSVVVAVPNDWKWATSPSRPMANWAAVMLPVSTSCWMR